MSLIILFGCASCEQDKAEKEAKESALVSAAEEEGRQKAAKTSTSGTSETAKRVRARVVCASLERAIMAFESEYNFLPFAQGEAMPEADLMVTSDDALMTVLTGKEDRINPKKIVFFQVAKAKGDLENGYQDGLHEAEGGISLYDPWGNKYRVLVDYDYDGKIASPFEKGELIRGKRVIIFSVGKDGRVGTEPDNKDNVTSLD